MVEVRCSSFTSSEPPLDIRTAIPIVKTISCLLLFLCTVSATSFAELSRSTNGAYPYNTFVVPCLVEMLKLIVSALILLVLYVSGNSVNVSFSFAQFSKFVIPAFCYFISNNCMFYIIRELGPTTYQITNNLKVLSTALLMRIFLRRKLSWARWKALALLVVGSIVAELKESGDAELHGSIVGYFLVLCNSFASSAGGVFTEKLLKDGDAIVGDSIFWKNVQLYFFGIIFGYLAFAEQATDNATDSMFEGLNLAACGMIISQTLMGLSVSFVLKYIDNIAKCFVAVFSMLCVAFLHTSAQGEVVPLRLVLSIIIIFFALEQYNNST